MIKKFLEAEVKAINQEEGTFEVIASSGKMDRLGDTIEPKGWYLTNYKKNPVILWSHSTGGFGSAAVPPVARAAKVWIEDEKELKIKGQWAETPFAKELRTLVEGGFLNAVSVGFLPLIETEQGKGYEIEGKFYRRATDEEIKKGIYDSEYGEKFAKQELLEVSWVSVPALPQALVSARKMNLELITKELETIEAEDKKEKEEIKIEEKDFISKEVFEKPYPNEHSCRLESPNKYNSFARKNCAAKSDGKCIDHIYGITSEKKSELQAMRFNKEVWTEGDARSYCKERDGTFEAASKKELIDEQLDKVKNFISETEKAISVLKGLLPELDATPADDTKGRIPEKKIKSQADKDREAEIKLLKLADKTIESLLIKLRR